MDQKVLISSYTRMMYFSYLSSISYVFALLGPVLASATMSVNLWLPFYLGLGLSIGAIPILLLVPKHTTPSRTDSRHREEPQLDTDETAPLIPASPDNPDQDGIATTSRYEPKFVQRLISEARKIFGRPNFPSLISIAVLLSVAGSSTSVYLLYLSKRYHRSFAEVPLFF